MGRKVRVAALGVDARCLQYRVEVTGRYGVHPKHGRHFLPSELLVVPTTRRVFPSMKEFDEAPPPESRLHLWPWELPTLYVEERSFFPIPLNGEMDAARIKPYVQALNEEGKGEALIRAAKKSQQNMVALFITLIGGAALILLILIFGMMVLSNRGGGSG